MPNDAAPIASAAASPWRTLGLAAVWYLAAAAAGVPFLLLAGAGRFPQAAAEALTAVLVPAVLLLPLLRGGEAAALLRARMASPWRVAAVLALVLLANRVMLWLLPVPVADIGGAKAGIDGWTLLGLAAVALAAPVAEELFFRGWLWARLSRVWPPGGVALATGAAFALAHGQYALSVAPLAVGLSWLRAMDGSLRTPLALHLAMNVLAVAATLARP
jgi:membrane protease YdiL (CAAX protease family)